MKVFITGGRGFVGKNLTKLLLEKGYQVVSTSRAASFNEIQHDNFRYISANTIEPGSWQNELNDTDVVVNLAGANIFRYWTQKYKQQMYDSRIFTTRNLVEALPKDRKITFISTSAVGFYGDRGEDILNETEPVGDDYLAKICEDWESEALKAQSDNVRVLIARFGVVAEKNGGAMKMMIPPFKFFVGGPLSDGQQWFPWIHLTDLLNAIVFLMEKPEAQGLFNFCAPKGIRNKDMSRTIGKLLRRPSFFVVPKFAINLALGELGSLVLNSQRAVPENLQKMGFDFKYQDFEAAMVEILG